MNSQEALKSINALLTKKGKQVLNESQEKLFKGIWEGDTFSKIALKNNYHEQSLREKAIKLYSKIKEELGIEVNKINFRNPIINILAQQDSQNTEEDESDSDDLHKNRNPFIPLNGRVEKNSLFFDREREIGRVFELLNSGSSVVLIGEEGIGKSSLLWMISQEAESRLNVKRQPVFLDLNLLHNESQFYSDLCHKIGIPESQDYQLTRNLRNRKILLAIDNLGKLNREGFTRQIRDYLRGLAEGSNSPLKLILTATESVNNLFKESQEQGNTSPLAGICQEEHIYPWDEATMHAFITSRLTNTSVSFTEEEIIQLIQESGGHPRKLMQLCYRTYSGYVENFQ